VSNSGTITGTIDLGGGSNKFTNWGSIDLFTAGDGSDTFVNFKKVGTKIVSGIVTTAISLGAGDDLFLGGKRGEVVSDTYGADSYKLGGGNDVFNRNGPVVPATDTVDGGKVLISIMGTT